MAYYRTCPKCGANLDPDEKCDCGEENRKTEDFFSKIMNADPATGQFSFRLDRDADYAGWN